jgi:hypothetical protein
MIDPLVDLLEESDLDGNSVKRKYAFLAETQSDVVYEDCVSGPILFIASGFDPENTFKQYVAEFYKNNKRYPAWFKTGDYFYLILQKGSPVSFNDTRGFSESFYIEVPKGE